jgi:dolichol-phosphate mannosyltransferase
MRRAVQAHLVGSARIALVRRPLRFIAVGGSGVLVNSVSLFIFVELAGFVPLAAAAVSTEFAILNNFTLNDRWTFRDVTRRHGWIVRATRYNLVALGGMLTSLAVLAALIELGGLHYLLANFGAIAAATAWNYSAGGWLTWSAWRFGDVAELGKKLAFVGQR